MLLTCIPRWRFLDIVSWIWSNNGTLQILQSSGNKLSSSTRKTEAPGALAWSTIWVDERGRWRTLLEKWQEQPGVQDRVKICFEEKYLTTLNKVLSHSDSGAHPWFGPCSQPLGFKPIQGSASRIQSLRKLKSHHPRHTCPQLFEVL